jgi:3-oxoacyl-[acyl-carrier-protein] synthase II
METYENAVARGARIYAEVTGFGNANDATEVGVPDPEGRGLAHAIGSALKEAGSAPEDIGYIAAEGSGTQGGDVGEAAGIRSAMGAAADTVLASTVKPATGNMVAAAGALNVGVAALGLYHSQVPPTLHLEHPDPACSLDWVPDTPRDMSGECALAVARGIEGQNVVLALRKAR